MGKLGALDEFAYSVATLPPTPQHRRLAFVVVVVMLAAYGAMVPVSGTPLPRLDSFIPTVMAIIFVTDLVTAVLLFGQFSAGGSSALLMLASGYLFSSLIAIPYTLTFPGVFAPVGLLGAGTQSAVWLKAFSLLGFAAATVGYAFLSSGKATKGPVEPSQRPVIALSVVIVIAFVCTLTAVVIAANDFMPRMVEGTRILPWGYLANGLVALINVAALLLLWSRERSTLDLWLMVVVCAQIMETALVALLMPSRFSVIFYSTRVISLLVSKVVLIVLLSETMRLYARLSIAIRTLQRERANRLTSAEAAVAAIAHEVRQPLTSMNAYATAGRGLLDRTSPDVPQAIRAFEEIRADTSRANGVFNSFLKLFREGRQDSQAIDVNTLILDATRLLRKDLGDHNVTARMELASDLPLVQGHSGQLREVMLNLIQNAIDAMATTTNRLRVLSIATSRLGSGIFISLQDTGPGIETQKLATLFDAFVTTKAEGTGLGLAICKMIVDQHGGKLSVESGETGGGARFEITLPTIAAPSLLAAE